ncbi:MAG: hypothetical protein E3K37_01405 [Candidatus Kuenenia sp.]|nr:hypothetical protein [Candidatus Kuenenia hertensis]
MEFKKDEFTIIIDTRESLPYEFPDVKTVTRKLDAGDYSIEGYETRITIERKTLADAYGTIGQGRKRFINELERFKNYEYAAIVIESDLKNFLQPPPYSKLNPKSAINSLLMWSIRYKTYVFFAHDRNYGMTLTLRLLEKFRKHCNESKK